MENNKSFAKRLKFLRESRELTMEEFCNQFNGRCGGKLNKSTISRYENETQEPMISTVKSIADFFDVDPSYLLGYSAQEPKLLKRTTNVSLELNEHEEKLIIAYRNNPDMCAAIDRLAGLEPVDYEEYRARYIEMHAKPFAASDGQDGGIDEAVELFDRSERGKK